MTGNDATLDELDDAISPIDDTVPYTAVVDPLGVIVAWSPTCISPTSVSSTDELTVYEEVDTTTIWALLELEELEVALLPNPTERAELEVDELPPEAEDPDPDAC